MKVSKTTTENIIQQQNAQVRNNETQQSAGFISMQVGNGSESDIDSITAELVKLNPQNDKLNNVSSAKDDNKQDKKKLEISEHDAKILKGEAEQGAKFSEEFMNDIKDLVMNLAKEIDNPNPNQKRRLLNMHVQANIAKSLGVDVLHNYPSAEIGKFISEAMKQ